MTTCSQLTPPGPPDDELLEELELLELLELELLELLELELLDELELEEELLELEDELLLPEPQLTGPPLPDWLEQVLMPIQLWLFSHPQPLLWF